MIERASFHLLGRHVRDGADDRSYLRQADLRGGRFELSGIGLRDLRQAKVENFYPAILGQHDVGGFQIAMGDVLLIRRVQGLGQGHRDIEKLGR